MKHWKRTAAGFCAAAILCGTLPILPAGTGGLLPILTASADSGMTFDAETHTLTLAKEVTQDYESNSGKGITLPDGVKTSDVEHVVVKASAVFPENSSFLFYHMTSMKDITFEPGFDTSNITHMRWMFSWCVSLTDIDLRYFDTSNVTDMSYMFYNDHELTSLDLGWFNTSGVTNMEQMFCYCSKLVSVDLSDFNTSRVTDMEKMFAYCNNLERIIASEKWSTENVKESRNMFLECSKLKGETGTWASVVNPDASNAWLDGKDAKPGVLSWNVACFGGKLRINGHAFQNNDGEYISGIVLPSNTTPIEVYHIEVMPGAVLPKNCSYLFADMHNVQDITFKEGFHAEGITYMSGMFKNCLGLESIDMRCFDTSNVQSTYQMFYQCVGLRKADLSTFDTSNLYTTSQMFRSCEALNTIMVSNRWSLGQDISSKDMFTGCLSLVGGNGTTYDMEITDRQYACIDKPGQPGYLTEKKYTVLREESSYPLVSGGKNCVYTGFNATIPTENEIVDYGLIYYNSGTVITTPYLTLDNVGICGIQKTTSWNMVIPDNGTGVTAVGFVTEKDKGGFLTTHYTGELGGNYTAMTQAANSIRFIRHENKAVKSSGANKVYLGFDAVLPNGYSVVDYGLLYYNSGTVINATHLKLGNVGVCGIKQAKYWSANITDLGYGVRAVGFVKVKDQNGCTTVLYTEELGNSYKAITNATNAVKLKRLENKPVTSGGKNKVFAGFSADVPSDYTVTDYGLIYYNSGTVINTSHLTLENVGICGIQKAKYWSANITDNGYGVVCVGFVKVKDRNGYVTTLYTEELGNSYKAMTDAAKAIKLIPHPTKASSTGGMNLVYVGFQIIPIGGYTILEHGIIYYNSGTVITTPYLTLENICICGIKSMKATNTYIQDLGYGVTAVGYVRVKDAKGYVTTLYTGELGAKFADLPH